MVLLQMKGLNVSAGRKISELLANSFMTLAFSFELIIWRAALCVSVTSHLRSETASTHSRSRPRVGWSATRFARGCRSLKFMVKSLMKEHTLIYAVSCKIRSVFGQTVG